VRCQRRDGAGVLEVRDRGPGVDANELARLGQRFYRAAGARGPGSGLGLSIVQRIAEGCGARVSYASGDDDRGFVVTVSFPAPPQRQ
jgi:signal transduction histidine kinase